ncbi:MAG: hypothetical protein HOU01_09865 [Streptomycetaceae bacterium]|nr:hypothetical protein [Streptomycetaceae bacterium]
MTIAPSRDRYRVPWSAFPQTDKLPLANGELLVIRTKEFRGKIVDFALTQATSVGPAWMNIARIDCCWGTVHRHLFDKNGEVLVDHEPICDIPAAPLGYDVVDFRFSEAWEFMHNEWELNLRRWHGDPA